MAIRHAGGPDCVSIMAHDARLRKKALAVGTSAPCVGLHELVYPFGIRRQCCYLDDLHSGQGCLCAVSLEVHVKRTSLVEVLNVHICGPVAATGATGTQILPRTSLNDASHALATAVLLYDQAKIVPCLQPSHYAQGPRNGRRACHTAFAHMVYYKQKKCSNIGRSH